MAALALILGAVVVFVELSLQQVTSRRGLAVAIGVPVVVMVAMVAIANAAMMGRVRSNE